MRPPGGRQREFNSAFPVFSRPTADFRMAWTCLKHETRLRQFVESNFAPAALSGWRIRAGVSILGDQGRSLGSVRVGQPPSGGAAVPTFRSPRLPGVHFVANAPLRRALTLEVHSLGGADSDRQTSPKPPLRGFRWPVLLRILPLTPLHWWESQSK